jgi:hypothetical protein
VKALRCDGCDRVIRDSHHELVLKDLATGQVVGRYHGICQHSASRYFAPGAAFRAVYFHPARCGENQERCDSGCFEVAS